MGILPGPGLRIKGPSGKQRRYFDPSCAIRTRNWKRKTLVLKPPPCRQDAREVEGGTLSHDRAERRMAVVLGVI